MSRRRLLSGIIGLWIVLIIYTYFYFMLPLLNKRWNIEDKTDNMDTLCSRSSQNVSAIKVETKPGQPWYIRGGTIRPGRTANKTRLFPGYRGSKNDGIHDQLMLGGPEEGRIKKIMLRDRWEGVDRGRDVFLSQGCPVSQCSISTDVAADLVIFGDNLSVPGFARSEGQLWMMYSLESPESFRVMATDMFNWTATYRTDSTIVAPYGKWRYYHPDTRSIRQEKNFASGKTRQVAWFVSNCMTPNDRMSYAKELSRYIQVDIYGACGNLKCQRHNDCCYKKLRDDYKFYLAFENSNCRDYITEKFFINALSNDVIPIVMGARPEDYARVAPRHSYIHVEQFQGPRELAIFLHKLDQQDHLYNEYFQWKGTGEFIETRFFCRVCSMLHSGLEIKSTHYKNIKDWWSKKGTCINQRWTKRNYSLL